MKIDAPSHLNLLFPQWQGSGPSNILYHAANTLALVWLDAHADLNTPASSPSGHFHGMPLRTLCGQGDPGILGHCFSFLSPNQVILAGAREFDPAEQTFIQDHGVTQVRVHEMAADPTALIRAIRKKGCDHVYIHIDMDVVDPGDYPHVKHPTPHGLMADTLEKIVSEIAAFHVAGVGLMEFTTDRMEAGCHPGLPRLKALMDLFR